MKFTYNWLKDYVDLKIPPEELAEKLTMAGLEVVSLEKKDGDYVFEAEITSNRPDWLSVLGIAREVAALTRSRLNFKDAKPVRKTRSSGAFKIEVEDRKDCPLYTARIIKDVRVGVSPEWLRKRLELVGCRSVNNVVDITNYCLFELGEPLHAFDLDRLDQGKVIVRRGKAGEKIATIDGVLRSIGPDTLVIADSLKALAIAGVMGGKESEVTFATKNILLEAAAFNPILIRRVRQAQSVQSESSYRFERGVDLKIVGKASQRAAGLIEEVCAGKEVYFKSSGLSNPKERVVTLNPLNAGKILGVEIKTPKVKQILSGLGFTLKGKAKGSLTVGIPAFRQDISLEEDLIEEAARIFGYERIPSSLPRVLPSVTKRDNRAFVSNIKSILIGLGLSEAITYSLTDSRIANEFNPSVTPLKIMNPLSREQEVLRTTLAPGLSRAIAHNLNQQEDYIALFEIGNVFSKRGNLPYEELKLGIALSGAKRILFNESAVKDELGLLNLKGMMEELFARLRIQGYEFAGEGQEAKAGIYINKEEVGYMAMLAPALLDKAGIKNKNVFILEVSLGKLASFILPEKRYAPLPKYPGITRDISFILKKESSVREILPLLKEKGAPLLRSLKVVDYYKGKQIPEGYRGLTLACVYSSSERTLTEAEIAPVHDLICQTLKEQFGAQMR